MGKMDTAFMGKTRNAYTILVQKPEPKMTIESTRRRYENNIKMSLRERVQWYGLDSDNLTLGQMRAFVNTVMKLRAP
jgi:hypothetical protein